MHSLTVCNKLVLQSQLQKISILDSDVTIIAVEIVIVTF